MSLRDFRSNSTRDASFFRSFQTVDAFCGKRPSGRRREDRLCQINRFADPHTALERTHTLNGHQPTGFGIPYSGDGRVEWSLCHFADVADGGVR